MPDVRNEKGQFAAGNKGGPGRPPKARELAYLSILREAVTLQDWKAIIQQAVVDARLEGDPNTRNQARRFLAEYCIGKPAQTVNIETDTGDTFSEYDGLTDEQLDAIIASVQAADADAGVGEADPPGQAETPG